MAPMPVRSTKSPCRPRGSKAARSSLSMPDGFGRHMLAEWALDPSVTYLNHGTVGAPPRRVLDAQQKLRDEIEKQPSRFLLRELVTLGVAKTPPDRPLLRIAADQVAEFLGVSGKDLVF